MALPTYDNLITIDFTFMGEPFVSVPGKSTIDLFGIDYTFNGEPFVGNARNALTPTSNIKTIGGLAIANVKTVGGLAIASVKTVGGLS